MITINDIPTDLEIVKDWIDIYGRDTTLNELLLLFTEKEEI